MTPTHHKLAFLQLLADSLAGGKIEPATAGKLQAAVADLDAAWTLTCQELMRVVKGVTAIAVDAEKQHVQEAQTLQGKPALAAQNPSQN